MTVEELRQKSADEARRHPERYRSGYPGMLDDDQIVLVTREDFERIPDYSGSQPTGVYLGKIWRFGKRNGDPTVHGNWGLGMFAECDPPEDKTVLTMRRPLVVVE